MNPANLSVLDLFILFNLDRGAAAPYDLHRRFGISLGGSLPSLKRLLKAKLVSRSEAKTARNRPRYEFTITAAGKRQVREQWQGFLERTEPLADLESVLRIAEMGIHYGTDRKKVAAFLHSAAQHRKYLGDTADIEWRQAFGAYPQRITFTSMRASCDARRYYGESEALQALAERVAPKKQRRRALKPQKFVQQTFKETMPEAARKP